ncbi:response regulator [Dyadobacter sp. CY323]|uniref:response regulator n=1 Tax=Dyadobacter sp. CY323 TaxID=2907302 RepID=UPI001F23E848|nr:response regulator [Dyadobacter sp. CY323]MCE6987948.1 response regulator [Dyadobacter sp. CY323]
MGVEITIFIADDDQDDRYFLIQALSALNDQLKYIEVPDGTVLIRELKSKEHWDQTLVIVDMNMPRLNGLDTVKQIRLDDKLDNIPILMMSTSSDEWLVGKARNAGITKFSIKPSTFEDFLDLAKQICSEFDIPINKK